MGLVQRLQPLNDRLLALSTRFGVPQNLTQVVQEYTVSDQLLQVVLFPNPKIQSLTSRDVINFKVHQVTVNNSEFWLKDVSRTYDDRLLSVSKFRLDPVWDEVNQLWINGRLVEPLFIERNQLMGYDIMVREFNKR